MAPVIDYYFTPQSPWTYLGHARFAAMAQAAGATVNVLPVDLNGKVFPVSGGLPLAQRAPQRQAYRLVEMQRFADHLKMPIHLQTALRPANADAASRLIISVARQDGSDAAMALSDAVFNAVWVQQRNIADPGTLAELLAEVCVDASRLAQSGEAAVQTLYEANTQRAIDAGVFGAPCYVVDGEMFWGQDRLEFVARKLARG